PARRCSMTRPATCSSAAASPVPAVTKAKTPASSRWSTRSTTGPLALAPACSVVRSSRGACDAVIADSSPATDHVVAARAVELFKDYEHEIHVRTDRLFAGLMALQWVAGVLFALWVSPLAWAGGT